MKTRWYDPMPRDPYPGSPTAGRVWAWETVPVDFQDRGGNDEGYCWKWCDSCGQRTEHDIDDCLTCG